MGKCIAVIGAGGKTTAVRQLAQSKKDSRVLLTTTTHMQAIHPPESRVFLDDPAPQQLLCALEQPGIVSAGVLIGADKISSPEPTLLQQAAAAADYTFCEADGARCCSLKLHRSYEPVVPAWADGCLIVAGLTALGRPVCEAVHRYALNPVWEKEPNHPVGTEDVLYCLREAAAAVAPLGVPVYIFLNQADAVPARPVQILLDALTEEGFFARAGSLQQDKTLLARWLLDGERV